MKTLRTFGSVAFGFALMYLVLVYARGVLAAMQVPRGYFQWFGHENREMALFTMNLWLTVLPEGLLLIGGMYLGTRIFRNDRTKTALAIVIGALFSYAFLIWLFDWTNASGALNSGNWISSTLQRWVSTPWWALPALASPFFGLLCGFIILRQPSAKIAR